MSRKRVLISAILLALVATVFAVPGIQLAGAPSERLANGSFEEGFASTAAGFVGLGWRPFDNGGLASYGFYDETWAPVVYDGQHSQLIEINSIGFQETDADRFAGIYQTVVVVPGETYELSMRGMLRGLEGDPDLCCDNYRVQYGIDYNGSQDWSAVESWVDIPWDTVHPRLTPGSMEVHSTTVKATGPRMTLFVRAWKKWATVDREFDLDLDAISLKGAMPPDRARPWVDLAAPTYPVVGWSYSVQVAGGNDVGITRLELYDGNTLVGSVRSEVGLLSLSHRFTWRPATTGRHTLKAVVWDVAGRTARKVTRVVVGREGQFVINGDFEGGFAGMPGRTVGQGWGWFENGGKAIFGFYPDNWPPVVHEGRYSQLLEINTLGRSDADPDRYAGIYQTVSGLTPGATYQLSLFGMLRSLGDEADQVSGSYLVQWGYDPTGGTDWTAVENWVGVPWDTVYPRLDPGELSSYTTSFEAPSRKITLFLRAWKKWATPGREFDVNLDAITLKGYK